MTDNIDVNLINIHDLYWKGKGATELFLIIIPLFLLLLMLIGYLLQKNKQKKATVIQGVFVLIFIPIVFMGKANAMCPVCTVAIGAGLGFSRLLGIDDLITSIWMGGLVVSTVNWILSWLEKRKIKSLKATSLTYIIMYGLVFIPLYLGGTIGAKGNTFLGIDKVFFGIIIGTIFFILGMIWNNYIKKQNNGNVIFPFQKVVLPISALWFATLIFYYIIYYILY